ncbi:DUF1796 family putative cysteine peptidase [Sphingomonas sp.]|uniref:DUF1796 family putative cysteine peptidase n=1 Tax=Sphingomonas sp. TaxID=28214 RepID=UPI003AFF7A28
MSIDLSAPAIAALVRNRRDQRVPFVHAVSLGTNCYAAWLLQGLGLRRGSHPFDWIFSTPAMVLDILDDDFRHFLDPAEHERGGEPGRCRHRSYQARFGVEWVFNHHDPTRPEDARYFRRCVDRFRAVTGGPDKTLLLMINIEAPVTPELFAQLCDAVERCGPDNTMLCINVGCARDVLAMGMAEPFQIGRHRLRTYRSTSEIDGVRFANPLDDLVLRGATMQFRFDLPPARDDPELPVDR